MTGTVQGREVVATLYEESAFNDETGVTVGEKMYYRTMGGGGSLALDEDDTISGNRGQRKPVAGQEDLQLPLAMHIAPESCGMQLKSLMGVPTTVGVGPYTHTFDLNGAIAASQIIEKDYGARVTAAKRFVRHRGCRVNDASFDFGPSGFLAATFNYIGAQTARNLAAALDAAPDDYGHRAFSMRSASITVGGATATTIQKASVKISDDLDTDTHVIGNGGVRGSLDPGAFIVTGTIDALFQDVDLIEDAENLTDSSLEITIARGTGDGSAGNESFKLTISHLTFKLTDPPVNGPKGMRLSLNFLAHCDGTSEVAVVIELKNQRASY